MVKTARRRPVVTDGASGTDPLCGEIRPSNNQRSGDHQVVALFAKITSDNMASAAGLMARGTTPVLKLCRLLVSAGFDPTLSLWAYRGDMLCLTVRAIGAGAALTVDEHNGTRLSKWKPFSRSAVSIRIARQGSPATLARGVTPEALTERAP